MHVHLQFNERPLVTFVIVSRVLAPLYSSLRRGEKLWVRFCRDRLATRRQFVGQVAVTTVCQKAPV